MTHDELTRHLVSLDLPASQAGAVFGHLHRWGRPLLTVPRLSARQVQRLQETTQDTVCEVVTEASALAQDGVERDETEKLVFRLVDGRRVEGVIIPEGERSTFCVSSQVGCAMACTFCATARLGLARPLTPAEIVKQVYHARDRAEKAGRPLRNVVFMGMGEPLHHYENTRAAIDILTCRWGLSLGFPKITISTVGLVPRIAQLGADFGGRLQLALSLNAGTDETRRRIMPITEKWNLESLKEALRAYPTRRNRFHLLEYVVLPGVNDDDENLDGVAAFTRGLPAVVNLIPWNPFAGAPFQPPTFEDVGRIFDRLRARDVHVSVRLPRGRPMSAACGQLALQTSAVEAQF